MTGALQEYQRDSIWLKEYPIHYAGCDFTARMTIVRLANGNLFIHSPCEIDDAVKEEIDKLGMVEFIVAPGSYHYFYVDSAQSAFPTAETLICPGIERKRPELEFDWILGDRPDPRWEADFEQVLVRGNRFIWEVAFFHKTTKTLILVDLIEYMTDHSVDVNWVIKFWWKAVFHMWNKPKPAPEYQMGWKDKAAARLSLQRILKWDFDNIIIAHGNLINTNAKAMAMQAWAVPLGDDQ